MDQIINHAVLSLDFWQDTVTYEGSTMPTGTIGCEVLNIPDSTIENLDTPCNVLNQLLQGMNTGSVDMELLPQVQQRHLRAAEIGADAILLAKNIDGVYSADPAKDPTAVRYDEISYDEVLAKHLAVMDTTATSLSMDNHIPVLVFALKDPENILRVVMGEKIGTVVTE